MHRRILLRNHMLRSRWGTDQKQALVTTLKQCSFPAHLQAVYQCAAFEMRNWSKASHIDNFQAMLISSSPPSSVSVCCVRDEELIKSEPWLTSKRCCSVLHLNRAATETQARRTSTAQLAQSKGRAAKAAEFDKTCSFCSLLNASYAATSVKGRRGARMNRVGLHCIYTVRIRYF